MDEIFMSRKYETQHFIDGSIGIIPPHLESPDFQHWQQILREWLSEKPIYQESFQDWKRNVERIGQSNPIYVIGHHEGLGDTVHEARFALVFANRFPDKKIVYTTSCPEIFDKAGLPTNLQIVDSDSVVHAIHRDRNRKAIGFNPSA